MNTFRLTATVVSETPLDVVVALIRDTIPPTALLAIETGLHYTRTAHPDVFVIKRPTSGTESVSFQLYGSGQFAVDTITVACVADAFADAFSDAFTASVLSRRIITLPV